ncbi:uncharacterized protein LOC123557767 [Mercenaria mercenaria]|uniref:uncharacterized protein LOC123557767 n=1 Tax=Mercenaria mercenaria TaxID=6596 RepID=UPI00234F4F03|nr:uncharacterized protein LOC123557767 [Mercenaria mercenaria]
MLILTFIWILIVRFQQEVFSLCTLPTQFQNSVWIDSDKGELVFDTVNMTGWDFRDKGGTLYEDWQCFNTSTVGTKLYLIMVNTQNVVFLSDEFTPYLCMELTEITANSYYYYLGWAEEEKYRDERISATYSTTVVSDPVDQLCLDLTNPFHAAAYPDTGEYHVLVKKGNELDAKQECPSTFFGEYSYNVTDIAANTDYCGTGDEVWDVCTDYEQMTFNYTICNTEIAYSGNGSVFCLVSITSGSYTYHTVYNEDNTADISSGTYRFTCLMSSIASDGSLNVSQTPGSCKKSQTPNDQPVFAYNSSTAGLNLQLTPRRLCRKCYPTFR